AGFEANGVASGEGGHHRAPWADEIGLEPKTSVVRHTPGNAREQLAGSEKQVMLYPRFLRYTALRFHVLQSRYALASMTCVALPLSDPGIQQEPTEKSPQTRAI